MYAKLVLDKNQKKHYLPITRADEASYNESSQLLTGLINCIPNGMISSGYNTSQVLNYNYRCWKFLN
jgi:hypothetical protein